MQAHAYRPQTRLFSVSLSLYLKDKLADNPAAAPFCLLIGRVVSLNSLKCLSQLVSFHLFLAPAEFFLPLVLLQGATHLVHYACSGPKEQRALSSHAAGQDSAAQAIPTREGKKKTKKNTLPDIPLPHGE